MAATTTRRGRSTARSWASGDPGSLTIGSPAAGPGTNWPPGPAVPCALLPGGPEMTTPLSSGMARPFGLRYLCSPGSQTPGADVPTGAAASLTVALRAGPSAQHWPGGLDERNGSSTPGNSHAPISIHRRRSRRPELGQQRRRDSQRPPVPVLVPQRVRQHERVGFARHHAITFASPALRSSATRRTAGGPVPAGYRPAVPRHAR
jgi:hypothetical protein